MKIAFVLDRIIIGQVPLGVGYVASMLKKYGHEVIYFPLEPDEDCIERVAKSGAGIVAYSVSSGLHRRYLSVNRQIKKATKIFSVFGGPHPTFFPDMIHEEGVDAICLGEGEFPMAELADALERGEEPSRIQNIYFKDAAGKVYRTRRRPFLQDLDSLPYPDLDMIEEFPRHKEVGIAYVIAGRGCPYTCNFCFNHVAKKLQKGKYVRMRSAESVLGEIRRICERYPVQTVAFQDDTFTMHREWLLDFLPRYKEEFGIPYLVHTRADTMDEEIARVLKETGCVRVVIGLESGSDHLRNKIMNKRITTEDILRTASLVKDNGMELITQNLFGVPEETVETVLSTIDLNIKCKSDILVLHFYQPYPGTRLAEMSSELGLYSGTIDDIPESNHWRIVLDLKNRGEMEAVAKLSYFFVDYPQAFERYCALRKYIPLKFVRRLYLAALQRRDKMLLDSPERGVGSRWHSPKSC